MAWVKSSLQVKRRNDLESNDVETLWLELCPYKSKRPLFIAGVYRPPSHKVDDDKRLGKNIERVYLLDKEVVLLGDFNVDYLATNKFNKHPFVKTLRSLNLEQLITEVTRPLSNSCLDHIWYTHRERLNNASVMSSGMSDHLPIVAIRYKHAWIKHVTVTYRDVSKLDKEAFITSLKEAPWDCAFVFDETDDVVDAWYMRLRVLLMNTSHLNKSA